MLLINKKALNKLQIHLILKLYNIGNEMYNFLCKIIVNKILGKEKCNVIVLGIII